jgi:4'-phosphopantetheinyl transferase EntD
MIEKILPSAVLAEEVFGDLPDVTLFPAEEALIANAVDKRRREFATARACARAALARLGVPPVPILAGPRGAPQWPSGIVGSITHCAGYRCCAAGRACEVTTIGVDAEPHDVLPDGVLDAIALEREKLMIADLAAELPGVCWDRILFSAKESVYKAWFPLAHRWLGFGDADIEINPENHTFTARLLVPGPEVNGAEIAGFSGRWLVSDALIVTAIAVA